MPITSQNIFLHLDYTKSGTRLQYPIWDLLGVFVFYLNPLAPLVYFLTFFETTYHVKRIVERFCRLPFYLAYFLQNVHVLPPCLIKKSAILLDDTLGVLGYLVLVS